MSVDDTPNMTSSTYSSNVYAAGTGIWEKPGSADNESNPWPNKKAMAAFQEHQKHITNEEIPMTEQRRVVMVFIVDTDKNLPLENAVLHQGNQQFTDLTDEELFYELNIKEMIDQHNKTRAGILNKKVTEKMGRDVYLDPIRIRDLTMNVVAVATF